MSQSLLHAELRSGNTVSSTGFGSFFEELLTMLPSRTVIDYMRLDSGFSGEDIYNIAEKYATKGYVIKIKLSQDLVEHSEIFSWQRIEYTNYVIEVKSFMHQVKSWSKARRIVMVRYHPTDEDPIQLKLSDLDWHTVAMVTNLDWDGGRCLAFL